MAAEIAPGRPGNLTPEQEEKLRRLWQLIFQVCGVGQEQNGTGADSSPDAPGEKAQDADSKKTKKSRMSLFSRKGKKDTDADSTTPAPTNVPVVLNLGKDGEADKYGQTKHFYETLASQSSDSIRDAIWSMVKHDHPDALVLRFLRARKWDVERALIMLVSTMNWRAQEMKVDEDIMKNGEAAALAAEKGSEGTTQKLGHDFLTQIRKGISYIHGTDKQGRPICFVNVRLHRQGEQAEESLERYTVYLIETCRMLIQPPVDTATIVFDMTGFSMANMDYTPVKFMIKCFEANYPECLGTVLVHKAPWIFQGIWKVIRGWLDPVVANKVHFTNNAKELEEFVSLKQIPKDLEGEEDWTYQYVEPVEGENAKLDDTTTRDRLLAARGGLYKEYEEATLQWIQNPEGDKAAEIKARRESIATKLRDDYWNVDPYVRSRSYYDRIGVLQPGGKINWYPESKAEAGNGMTDAAVVAAPAPTVDTSADDVD
ncbi:Phosphatidylinositol transfer protein CSR1 [Madurella mycetomatis]|uniref:Phosphatidylinositol transfer protein CSR1 n=1 Tax=Madurella mycetomatis TaxID=100816 RepID=A0A175WFN2_9PEZI|nr:Phosphatidylinositol transfer protein CSR1 [Madurella mycetomatis]